MTKELWQDGSCVCCGKSDATCEQTAPPNQVCNICGNHVRPHMVNDHLQVGAKIIVCGKCREDGNEQLKAVKEIIRSMVQGKSRSN